MRSGAEVVPLIAIAYDPGGTGDGIATVRLVPGLVGETEDAPRTHVMPFVPPHAPAVVSPTVASRPFNHDTAMVPRDVPPDPAKKVCGVELAEILKSGAGSGPQPLKLNAPIAVRHALLEVAA